MDHVMPILFNAANPLVLRALTPQGFTIESGERILFASTVPLAQVLFRLTAGQDEAAVLTVETTWFEHQPA